MMRAKTVSPTSHDGAASQFVESVCAKAHPLDGTAHDYAQAEAEKG
jgi:hypothetical protein